MPHRDDTLPAADSGKLSAHVACSVDGCSRPLCAKGLCRLHWERQHRTGTTDDPTPHSGPRNPAWKDDAGYKAIHLRLNKMHSPEECSHCGTTDPSARYEWALKPNVPPHELMFSREGWAYSKDASHYIRLCKACHNRQDLGRDFCKRGHRLSGDNLYIQPSNGKRFCRQCQLDRRRARTERDTAARSARFEYGECG